MRRHTRARLLAVAAGGLVGAAAAALLAGSVPASSREEGSDAVDPPRRTTTRATPPAVAASRRSARGRPSILTPGSADYDPFTAARVFDLDTFELFEEEPRDPAFADRRERFLLDTLGGVLRRQVEGLALDGLECRATACRVRVVVPEAEQPWAERVLGFLRWCHQRTTRSSWSPDGVVIELVSFCRTDYLDHDRFEADVRILADRIEPFLANLRAASTEGVTAAAGP